MTTLSRRPGQCCSLCRSWQEFVMLSRGQCLYCEGESIYLIWLLCRVHLCGICKAWLKVRARVSSMLEIICGGVCQAEQTFLTMRVCSVNISTDPCGK